MHMIRRLIVLAFVVVQVVTLGQWAFAQTSQPADPAPTPHTMINQHFNDR